MLSPTTNHLKIVNSGSSSKIRVTKTIILNQKEAKNRFRNVTENAEDLEKKKDTETQYSEIQSTYLYSKSKREYFCKKVVPQKPYENKGQRKYCWLQQCSMTNLKVNQMQQRLKEHEKKIANEVSKCTQAQRFRGLEITQFQDLKDANGVLFSLRTVDRRLIVVTFSCVIISDESTERQMCISLDEITSLFVNDNFNHISLQLTKSRVDLRPENSNHANSFITSIAYAIFRLCKYQIDVHAMPLHEMPHYKQSLEQILKNTNKNNSKCPSILHSDIVTLYPQFGQRSQFHNSGPHNQVGQHAIILMSLDFLWLVQEKNESLSVVFQCALVNLCLEMHEDNPLLTTIDSKTIEATEKLSRFQQMPKWRMKFSSLGLKEQLLLIISKSVNGSS